MTALAGQLQRLMIDDSRSFEEIGRASGVDAALVWRWRKGRSSPRLGSFEAILNTLGYQLEIVQYAKPLSAVERVKPSNVVERRCRITRTFYDLVLKYGLTIEALSALTGISRHSFTCWGVRTDPIIANLERALSVMGYRLIILRKPNA